MIHGIYMGYMIIMSQKQGGLWVPLPAMRLKKAAPEDRQLAGLSTLGQRYVTNMRLIWKKNEKIGCGHKPSFVSYLWDKPNSQLNFLSQFLLLVSLQWPESLTLRSMRGVVKMPTFGTFRHHGRAQYNPWNNCHFSFPRHDWLANKRYN